MACGFGSVRCEGGRGRGRGKGEEKGKSGREGEIRGKKRERKKGGREEKIGKKGGCRRACWSMGAGHGGFS